MKTGVLAALELLQQAINGLLDIYIFRFWGTLILMDILLVVMLEVIANHPIDTGEESNDGMTDRQFRRSIRSQYREHFKGR